MGEDMATLLDCYGLGYWQRGHSDPAFRRSKRMSYSTRIYERFFTPNGARDLAHWFRRDYELFNLQLPEWIDRPTGQWWDLGWREVSRKKGRLLRRLAAGFSKYV